MGIRRVDARTGGGVRITSAIVHYLVWQSIDLPVDHATYRVTARRTERLKLLRGAYKLMHEQDADPFTPLVLPLLGKLALHAGCVLLLPRRQSLPDLLAGIVTAESTEQTPS
jgi:hypothetical protein